MMVRLATFNVWSENDVVSCVVTVDQKFDEGKVTEVYLTFTEPNTRTVVQRTTCETTNQALEWAIEAVGYNLYEETRIDAP